MARDSQGVPRFDPHAANDSYQRLAWWCFTQVIEGTLPTLVYEDLACAKEDLMRPLWSFAEDYQPRSHVAQRVKDLLGSKQQGETVLAVRLARICSDDAQAYNDLRKLFLSISPTTTDWWEAQKKKYLTSTLPYFPEFSADHDVQEEMLRYFESTRHDQVETTLRYFGGPDRWLERFRAALEDPKRRSKHWVYIWSFGAICRDGIFPSVIKEDLKDVVKAYSEKHEPSLSDLERRVINQALS